jgi:hypothetical protein
MVAKEAKIAERAYFKYLERGGSHGQDMKDWLEAEKELNNGGRPAKKSTSNKTASKKATTVKKTTRKSK